MTVETALEHARRAFALKKYEQAVEYYATALELQYVIEVDSLNRESDELHIFRPIEQRSMARMHQRQLISTSRMEKRC